MGAIHHAAGHSKQSFTNSNPYRWRARWRGRTVWLAYPFRLPYC